MSAADRRSARARDAHSTTCRPWRAFWTTPAIDGPTERARLIVAGILTPAPYEFDPDGAPVDPPRPGAKTLAMDYWGCRHAAEDIFIDANEPPGTIGVAICGHRVTALRLAELCAGIDDTWPEAREAREFEAQRRGDLLVELFPDEPDVDFYPMTGERIPVGTEDLSPKVALP